MANEKIGLAGVLLSLMILVGAGVASWVDTQTDMVRLDERLSAVEKRHEDTVKQLTASQNTFTESVHELTNVLQQLSITMHGVDIRLGGVEKQLEEIKAKI